MAETVSQRLKRQLHAEDRRIAREFFATSEQQIAEIFRAESSRKGRGLLKRSRALR